MALTPPIAHYRGGVSPSTRSRLSGGSILANLIGQIVIIGTGGAVRLTGSGLGCSTWPECEPGNFTPVWHEATSIQPFVEFGNRTVSAVLVVIALAVAVLVWTHRPSAGPARSDAFRRLGLVPLIGVLIQAVIGGITVRANLHPAIVGSHFLISAALVWVSTLLLLRWREGDGAPASVVGPRLRALGTVIAVLAVVVVVLGVLVTGSGPHSGDSEVGYRFAVDPYLTAKVHSAGVWLFVASVIALLVGLHRTLDDGEGHVVRARRRTWVLLAVTFAQGLVGYVQFFTGLPAALVGVHLLGAAALVVTTTAAVLGLRVRR